MSDLAPLPLLLPDGWQRRRLLVAVSGGCDSVALLQTLVEAGGQKLVVCHFNHRLRGRDSANDARFVASLAARLGLEYEGGVGKFDPASPSLEAVAREARYRFFAEVARRRRCRSVVLAHHADDQAETVLLNLFRGGGRAGLGAMQVESQRAVEGVSLRLLRPFLPLSRGEIEEAARARGWKWREDASNQTPHFTRNRIRHELLPLIGSIFGRDPRPMLVRTAALVSEEDAFLNALLPEVKPGELDLGELRALPLALLRRLLLEWLRVSKVPNVGYREVERVRSLLEPGAAVAKVNLPGDYHVRRTAGRVYLTIGGSTPLRR